MVFPGALGDLLLVLPTLRRLRRRAGDPRVTLVVAEPLRALARASGVAEEVASLDDASSAWLFGGTTPPAWLAARPAVWTWLGGRDAPVRARLARVADPVHVLSVERGAGCHHAAIAYARAAGVGGGRTALAAEARLDAPDSPGARRLLAQLARPVLAMHRGAGAGAKRWPPEAFAAVAAAWRRRGGDVVDVLGPAEEGDGPCAGTVPVRGWGLCDVAALLGRVDAYVGNDTGVSHLAGAAGARGVVVFTATDPARWRPLSSAIIAFRAGTDPRRPVPSPARVVRAFARFESLTSSHPGSSVRA
jgi:ADP-heptose:LPS heptosyltransferase